MVRSLLVLLLVASSWPSYADGPDSLKTVKAKTLTLQVPANWEQVATTSEMRAAQFRIPGEGGDAEDVERGHRPDAEGCEAEQHGSVGEHSTEGDDADGQLDTLCCGGLEQVRQV